MTLLMAMSCTRPPPVEVSADRISTDEIAVSIHTNQPVCLYDRTPIPADDSGSSFQIPRFTHQVLVHDDCRVHLQLGNAGTGLSSGDGGWFLERCVPAGATIERRVRLTDPLMRWQVHDIFWNDLKRPFALRPYPELVVDVGYRLPAEHESVTTRPITLTTGERANLITGLKKPYPKSHWASSKPIPVPGLPMLSTEKPCTPSPEWIP